MKFFNLSNDYLFKSVFRNLDLLIILVKDLYHFDLTGFYYENPKIQNKNKGLSTGEYDLLLTNGKEYVILEMQNVKYGSFINRTFIYRSNLIASQWKKKDQYYRRIKPVKLFWLLNYPYHKRDFLKYKMLEEKWYEVFGDQNDIYIFNIIAEYKSELFHKYKILFNAKNKEEVEALVRDKRVGKIAKKIIEYNEDTEKYQRIWRCETMIWTHEDELKLCAMTAYGEGEDAGEMRGEERGRKAAQKELFEKLLEKGVPIELLAEATKLTKQQIIEYIES